METVHDTANQQMIHDFGNSMQLVNDVRTKKAYLMNNGILKDTIDVSEMKVPEYTEMVLNMEKSIK